MFAAKVKAIMKDLGAGRDLIYNDDASQTIDMLTLFKVRVIKKTFWSTVKYTIIDQTLLDLLQKQDFTPEYTKKAVLENFKNLRDSNSGGRAKTGDDAAKDGLEAFATLDTVDGVSSFTLEKKTVDTGNLRKSCINKKINEEMVEMLKLEETEKLTFVYEIFYNTAPVIFHSKTEKDGLLSAVLKKFGFSLWWKKTEETNLPLSKDTTFAYRLMEITIDNNRLGIPLRMKEIGSYNKGWWRVSTDGDGDDETLKQLMEEIFDKADDLQPLAKLNESRRCDLLKTLRELLDDGDALSLLVETLDQSSKGVFECPQSPAVSSFMDLLDASGKSSDLKYAVHLLVSAMDALPDDAAALLAKCSPETLRVLQQLVKNLKESAQATLPESLPVSLQEEGELRWAVDLLRLDDQTLTELRAQWDRLDFSPGVILELVCLIVQGLSLMQPETHS